MGPQRLIRARFASLAALLWLLATFGAGAAAGAEPLVRWPTDAADTAFDGAGQFATFAEPKTGAGPFAVSVYVKARTLAGGNAIWGRGIARSTRDEQVGDWLLAVHPDGRVRFCNWRRAGDDPSGGHVSRDSVVTAGAWHQVVAVWDGSANHLYVDGVEARYTDAATGASWGPGHEVGRSWTMPDYSWAGEIDDLCVYDKAPSAAEVLRDFRAHPLPRRQPAPKPVPDVPGALLVHWPPKGAADDGDFDGGRSIAFPGVNEVGAGPFTVSVWVNASDLGGGDPTYGRGIARATHGEQIGDWLLSVHPDGRVRFVNWRRAGDDPVGSHVTVAPAVQPDSWYHIVAAWDGKANRIYVNGVEAEHAASGTSTGWQAGRDIGRSWTQPGYFWMGAIDGFRVRRGAPTAAEALAEFKASDRSRPQAVVKTAGDASISAALDREIDAELMRQKVAAAPAADDVTFYRRALLDLAGRIPTPAEIEAFLAERAPDKRDKLIDALLSSREMSLYWSGLLSSWLLPPEGRRSPAFLAYLRRGLAADKGWDRLVREMLIARPGGAGDREATAFLALRRTALQDGTIARDLGAALFGVNLRCAQCHDHPHVAQWKRRHFLGLSAFFARTFEHTYTAAGGHPALAWGENASGELEYAGKGGKKLIAPPMFLDGTVLREPAAGKVAAPPVPSGSAVPPVPANSRREALARLAISPKSPYLKRAFVNRVWRQLMGRGLVEPVDMMYEGNAASHPRLLDLLADDFAEHDFSIRRLLAVIAKSRAYARSSRWTGQGPLPDERLYAVAILKPLDTEQLLLSIPLALGQFDGQLGGPANRTLAQLRPVPLNPELLAELDAPGREFEPTARQALFLLNSSTVSKQLVGDSILVKSLSGMTDDAALARRAYLAILSRPASAEEIARLGRYLSQRGPASRLEACREIVWALVAGPELRFNH